MAISKEKAMRVDATPETVSRLRRAVKDFEEELEQKVGTGYYGKVLYEVDFERGQISGYTVTVKDSRR